MPSVKYTYTISSTCPHGVNIDSLSYEIRASDIVHALHYVYVDDNDDRVDMWFRDELDSTDQSKLVTLLNDHPGMPLPFSTTVSGTDSSFSRNLIINEDGSGIGVSQSMPFHVTSVTVAAPHELNSESHIGVLVDSQIPSFIARDSELINASGILNTRIDNLDFYTTDEVDTIASGLAAWDHDHDLRYIRINNQSVIDHGLISGLGDDDHTQYYNQTRGDLRYSQLGHLHDDRYYTESEVNTISGNINTKITNTSGTLQTQITYYSNHTNLNGLANDDHTQYHTDSRGDARYYTQTQLNNGQLDTRYYTETELNNGQLDNRYYTESEVNTISGNIVSQIITDHGNLTGLSDDDHTQYALVTGIRNITGSQTFNNDVVIRGNLVVSGTQIIAEVETIQVEDNIMVLNYGETAAGVSEGFAGVEIERGTATNYLFVFDESADVFKVGISGSLQSVATRQDTPLSSGIAIWNSSATRFDTIAIGTTAGTLAAGDHGHAQLHNRQHAINSSSDHTAAANRVFYSNNSGAITELPIGISGSVLTSTGESNEPSWTTTGQISTLLPICQVKRTTTLTLSAGIWTDIAFNVKEIETDDTVIQYDTVNTDRITIKQSGYYIVDYDANIYYEGTSRIRVNDTTVISGTYIPKDGDQNCVTVPHSFSRTSYVYLNANDFITLQLMSNYGLAVSTNASLSIASVKGIKGDTGPQGPGSSVIVQNNGSTVGGSPFGTLNFKGATVSGTVVSGVVDITVNAASTSPGSPTNSVQFNNDGSFGGDAGFVYSSASDKVTINGAAQTTRLVLGGEDDNNGSALYIQVDGDGQSEAMRTYFKRSSAGISGWVTYHYDGNTPNIRLIDEDDDPPYISFQTIGAGTYASPTYDNRFGTRGPVAGATTGFQWIVNGTSISEMDSQFFTPPKGTDAQRPGTPVAGMTRFNTTLGGLECYDGTSWQPQVFGTYFNEASSETDSSTTSTGWSQKVRLTTASLPIGKYRIGWSYNIYGASTSASPRTQVQINDTDTIHVYTYEPKDASTNEQDAVGGFYYYTVSTGGTTLNIDLDYSSESAGSSMTIRRARLEFWRVS